MRTEPFVPPPYPFDRLDQIKEIAAQHPKGALNLSIGAPHDAPPQHVVEALMASGLERGYPPSIGTPAYRAAAAAWLNRSAGTDVSPSDLIATVGSKELVVGLPHWLRLRRPDLDTVLYPELSYPSYAMGAELAGCRAVAVPVDADWRMDLDAIDPDDAARALCIWNASPGNPTGAVDDLAALAAWGRERGIPVFSDECYLEFTWDREPQSILQYGVDGVIAVHSLSKRSNFAGARAGFIAGDSEIVQFLGQVRQHSGLLVSGPVQHAAIAAYEDQSHVADQRAIYRVRMESMIGRLGQMNIECPMPSGGFYLWVESPQGDGWDFAKVLAEELGVVVSPGEFYGTTCPNFVRFAMVQDVAGR